MIKQIRNESVTSLADLDRQLVNRQSAVKTPVPIENIGNGLAQGETIEIQQTPNYTSNVDPKVG